MLIVNYAENSLFSDSIKIILPITVYCKLKNKITTIIDYIYIKKYAVHSRALCSMILCTYRHQSYRKDNADTIIGKLVRYLDIVFYNALHLEIEQYRMYNLKTILHS